MNLKNYLIAIDLDDTLVTNFDKYDEKSFSLLKKLSKDNYIVIATGRPFRSSKYYYDLLKLNTPIINYNGALLHHPKDSTFPKKTLHIDKKLLLKFINDNQEIIETVFCEIGDNIYLHKNNEYVGPYLHTDGGNLTIGNLEKSLPGNPNGAIVFSKIGTENHLIEYVESEFKGNIKIRIWHANEIVVSELYNSLTTKANALKEVAKYYNVPKEKIIAFGDGHNDIEMIKYAHIGVAMENGHPDLLKVAQFSTKSVKESGVYHFLIDLLEKNQEKH
ncbi:MAG TPA: HAD family hydrolase [Acholeplasmataceae bacterium]|jgi:Cof subfamily protein (haloacid dehalogenase superfamily)|nr:HAD family hydrolase [Acholeplasmataceae bacterium]